LVDAENVGLEFRNWVRHVISGPDAVKPSSKNMLALDPKRPQLPAHCWALLATVVPGDGTLGPEIHGPMDPLGLIAA
jgi:hypothetical protein